MSDPPSRIDRIQLYAYDKAAYSPRCKAKGLVSLTIIAMFQYNILFFSISKVKRRTLSIYVERTLHRARENLVCNTLAGPVIGK